MRVSERASPCSGAVSRMCPRCSGGLPALGGRLSGLTGWKKKKGIVLPFSH